MRSAWLVVLLIAACERGADAPAAKDVPKVPTAKGSVQFAVTSPELMDTLLATEAEVMRSEAIVRMMNDFEGRGQPALVTADAIHASRRGSSMIVEVSVNHVDPVRAQWLCDLAIRTYLEFRIGSARSRVQQRQAEVWRQLERTPDDAALKRKLDELEQESHTTRSDVRMLDRCALMPGGAPRPAVAAPGGNATPASVVFSPMPAKEATAMLATEVAVLHSEPVIRRANEILRTAAIHVARRGDTMIVDVSVTDPDPMRSATLSNILVSAYLEHRHDLAAEGGVNTLQPSRPAASVVVPHAAPP